MPRIAVVQRPPVLLDRQASLERAVESVAEAATDGAELVVFPEAFVPGYPTWIWRLRPGSDGALTEQLHHKLLDSAVDLSQDDLEPLRSVARQHQVHVLCGIDERDGALSRSTLYNTYLHVGADGAILNRHRKLMPTNPERMVWGMGDASGLRAIDSPCGRVGSLICWENFMPLARYALYAQGIEVLVSPTWDCGDGWVGTMQHIAREGRCWVVGCGTSMRGCDMPHDLDGRDQLYPDPGEWVNTGDSVVVAPGGEIVAGPLHREHGVLFADVDPARTAVARRSLDVAGHYSRPDIFQLVVQDAPQTSLVMSQAPESAGCDHFPGSGGTS